MKAADARNLVIAQIETERGLDAVEEIAAVDGIDCLWLGHFDLTNFLGHSGPVRQSPVCQRRQAYRRGRTQAWESARLHGGRCGIGAAIEDPRVQHDCTGTDHGILMAGVRNILSGLAD